MRAPEFWHAAGPSRAARLLAPVGRLYAAATARRVSRPGWRAPVPVLCCGNATAGGAGKTTLALDLAARLRARASPAFVTRGYGARVSHPWRVDPARDRADTVGDEPLLLATAAPTFVAADRALAARAAVAAGAGAIIMDDGLQNASLQIDTAFLVIDGASGFGNRRVIPAGPLREPIAAAAGRCRAAILIGADATGALAALPRGLEVLRADLVPVGGAERQRGRRVVAFAGIGRPDKFFASLRNCGAELAAARAFPDHHRYTARDLRSLRELAARQDAVLVTTAKDAVRLPASLPTSLRAAIDVLAIGLAWHDPAALAAILGETLA